jgi:DNA-binding CsgD family transcriptional regulator
MSTRRRRTKASQSQLVGLSDRLNAMAGPVLFVGMGGEVVRANEEGRKLLQTSGLTARTSLAAIMARNGEAKVWYLMPVHNTRGLIGFLASFRSRSISVPMLSDRTVRQAARAWGLTERKRQVLELVARGLPNSIVADTLAIAERTVEFHLSGIFDRAGVESRASLLARLFGR